ncbi:MAG: radical SAM protein [Dorea sp.]|jgi:radical SAM superfamily enzyme YgiQ (UPF0313 family)/ABC-type transporter lipoprotein component MlaA|nr:radical SAM protein [Dorea sp.]
MKSLLIFSPGWNPCSPYFALPILKAYLRDNIGYDIKTMDSNVEFYDYILCERYLEECLQRIESRIVPEYVRNTISLFKANIKEINYAIHTLRTGDYLKPEVRKYVDTIINNALYIINNAWEGLQVTFNGIDMKYQRTSSEEVYKACEDDVANPFINYYQEKVIPYIEKERIEFVGLSITGHSQLIPALTLCKMIKNQCQNVKHISLGGNYITRVADMICKSGYFNKDFFDSIMLYDGEICCKELIQALENGDSLEKVHNIIFMKNQNWIYTEFILNDVINISTPDYSDLPLNKYFAPVTIYPIYTSRSCYNECAFCTIPHATTGKYRALPIESVISNMKIICKRYKANHFVFTDETFDIKRMLKIATMLIGEKIEIYWYCETRFSPDFTYDACKLLYKSGCRQIQFGLESYNQHILDKMKKNTKIEWIDNAIENCIKAGISVHTFFFVGFPTETYDEAVRTFNYTSKIVTRSHVKYGVVSSRGFGAFGLEIGSTVWHHPDDFGITIIPNGKENDLRLNVDYKAKYGLSQTESEALVKSQNLRKRLKKRKSKDYELPWVDYLPEIHMAIIASDSPEIIEREITGVFSEEKLLTLLNKEKIYFPEFVSVVETEKMILFYNRNCNYAYSIPLDFVKGDIPRGKFSYNDFFQTMNKKIFSHLALLQHFSFIEFEKELSKSIDLKDDTILIKASLLEKYYNEMLEEWILLNQITNDSVVINRLSLKILELFNNPISLHDIIKLLEKNNINIPQEKIIELTEYYLKHDILYAIV